MTDLLHKRVKVLRTLKRLDGAVLAKRGQILTVGVQDGNRVALYDHKKPRRRHFSRWVVVDAPLDAVELIQ